MVRPLPVMSGAPSLFPPSSVESRDTSGKKLQTALRPGLREPHHHHHHHRHNRRNGSIEPTETGVFTDSRSRASWRPPVKPRATFILFVLAVFTRLRRGGAARRSSPFPSGGEGGGGRRRYSSGGSGGNSRTGEVLSTVRAEWRTARRRRYRWRSELGLRSWSWSCQRVRNGSKKHEGSEGEKPPLSSPSSFSSSSSSSFLSLSRYLITITIHTGSPYLLTESNRSFLRPRPPPPPPRPLPLLPSRCLSVRGPA